MQSFHTLKHWFKIYLSSVVLCDFKEWEVAFSMLLWMLHSLQTRDVECFHVISWKFNSTSTAVEAQENLLLFWQV
jgi:hypothetical protein